MLSSAYLRLSITDRCNLRCVYCLPEAASFRAGRASAAELMRLCELLQEVLPVRKLRITGGEPTIAPDLLAHVRHARTLTADVCMTTNGVRLAPLLPALRAAGLARLNISLDAVDAEGFRRFSRRDGLPQVVAAIRAALRLGFRPLKVNAVAMRGIDAAALVRFAAWEGVHLRFIELMPIGEAKGLGGSYLSAAALRERLALDGIALTERQDRDEPTSRVWAIDGVDAREASVGFITTMSAPFCATCDRLRLSSQGRLFTCLMDNHGTDLLEPLRAGDEAGVRARAHAAIDGKRPPERMLRHEVMAAIGG
jgi:cyclic pyranopterin phosphate synthase